MGLPRCARTPFGSKSWTNYTLIQQQPMPPSKKTHLKHHVIGGPPQWDDFPHQLHVCSRWSCTAKYRETELDISGMFHIELFRLQTAAQIFNLAWTWFLSSPKPQAHSASLGSTLKSPGRQDFVPKNLGVSLASRWSRLLSHLLSSLDVLWKLTGFPVGSSKKFLSNRWLNNGNHTGWPLVGNEGMKFYMLISWL